MSVFLTRMKAEPGWRVFLEPITDPGEALRIDVAEWGVRSANTGGLLDLLSVYAGGGRGVEFVPLDTDGKEISKEGHLIVGRFGSDISDEAALAQMFETSILRRPGPATP
jgi:hypothetical protein